MGEGGVTGTKLYADYYVQPMALTAYADAVRKLAGSAEEALSALGSSDVEATCFGRLPQSGRLAGSYESHRQASLAGLSEVPPLLLCIADALDVNAAVYRGVDEVVAAEIDDVR